MAPSGVGEAEGSAEEKKELTLFRRMQSSDRTAEGKEDTGGMKEKVKKHFTDT